MANLIKFGKESPRSAVHTVALIVAAGRGHRAGSDMPKQYAAIAGRPVLAWAIDALAASPAVSAITVVIHPDDAALYEHATASLGGGKLLGPVCGGQTRQASVRAGLESFANAGPEAVLIHDAARPFVQVDAVERVLAGLRTHSGAIAALPVADTLKRALLDDVSLTIKGTLPREGLWAAQTPQGFRYSAILEAHRAAAAAGLAEFTDDAAVAEWAGLDVALVQGSPVNFKITTAQDMERARMMISAEREPRMEPRVGSGFDVHRFKPGSSVWLCGVEIPHTQALEGHSDADVGLHALTDAILGAIGDGDIGQHFPPSDPAWRGAPSRLFLEDAARRVRALGGRIANVDVTLLCEEPRIGPYRARMQEAIAAILAVPANRIGIKATTTEGLGFTGRREGMAALASAVVMVPADEVA